ncbi:MAG TPA: 3-phosphoshikimate 1-carboxyvinyltransferase, partial [Xanthomonadales bacterium]|nr:3-phosphoshikimate 1-carboxyvinyltransferase [Xanthomonadales bacterium]
MSLDWTARSGKPLRGRIRVPGDKSISHRSMMLGSLASGVTEVEGFLEGEDTRATAAAFRAMGVRIEGEGGRRTVFGAGQGGLKAPAQPLDLGNSGTGMRLMAGILAAQRFHSTLVGDESLSRRPMKRVVEPLRRMGASIATKEGGLAPLAFAPVDALKAIDHVTDVPSAQVKSCVLLAGLNASGTTRVREAHPTRDHSERMLRAFGADVRTHDGWIEIDGGATLEGARIVVPGDFSSAAFFLVAASIVPGSDLVVEGVGVNPLRTGLLQALWSMGANIEVEDERVEGGEPVADLHVRYAPLHGIEVPEAIVPDMIDEFPVLFAAAAV